MKTLALAAVYQNQSEHTNTHSRKTITKMEKQKNRKIKKTNISKINSNLKTKTKNIDKKLNT